MVESDMVPDESLVMLTCDESAFDDEFFPLHEAKPAAMHRHTMNILAVFIMRPLHIDTVTTSTLFNNCRLIDAEILHFGCAVNLAVNGSRSIKGYNQVGFGKGFYSAGPAGCRLLLAVDRLCRIV